MVSRLFMPTFEPPRGSASPIMPLFQRFYLSFLSQPLSWISTFSNIDSSFCFFIALLITCSVLILCRRRYDSSESYDCSAMSPDTMSSLYPDRPIRPLPKRRLRERLSPEAVESIQYPPIPQLNQPLFSYPCDLQDRPSVARRGSLPQSTGTLDRHRACRKPGLPDSQDSDDEEGPRTIAIAWPSPEVGSRLSQKTDGGHPLVTNPVVSSTSSIDGYDSLENTNNKKKRKIPTAGDHLLNGGSTLSEISGLSISHSASCSDLGGNGTTAAVGNQNSSTSSLLASVQGMSGPGRGRFGRTRNGRSPLRALSDSTHNWARNNGKLRPLPWAPAHGKFFTNASSWNHNIVPCTCNGFWFLQLVGFGRNNTLQFKTLYCVVFPSRRIHNTPYKHLTSLFNQIASVLDWHNS